MIMGSIAYDNLWKTMQKRGVTKYALINKHNLSPSLITRLKRNQVINTNTICTLCEILDCRVEDILEYKKD